MLFTDVAAGEKRIDDAPQASALRDYLGRLERPRPLVVAVPPAGRGDVPFDADELVALGADVAVVATPMALRRLSERLPRAFALKPGDARVFAAHGALGEPELAAAYCYFNPSDPDGQGRAVKRHVRAFLAEQRQAQQALHRATVARRAPEPHGAGDAAAAMPAGAAPASIASAPVPGAPDFAVPASASPAFGSLGASQAPVGQASAGQALVPSPPLPSPPAYFSPGEPVLIADETALDALAAYLADPRRDLPVVVVTKAGDQAAPFVNVADLARQVQGCAVVAQILSGALTWRLSSYLADAAVFGGALRLYPASADGGPEADPDRYYYPVFDRVQARYTLERVAGDVLDLAARSAVVEPRPAATPLRTVTAEVRSVLPSASCALCCLDSSGVCSAYTTEVERLLGEKGLPAERVFIPGMRLRGELDAARGTLTGFAAGLLRTPDDALRGYRAGMTVLARVKAAGEATCELELFPGFAVAVDAADVAGRDVRPADVLSAGQVVCALVVECGEKGADWLLSIREADDAPTAVAPSLLEGGPSWLLPEDLAVPVVADAPASAAGAHKAARDDKSLAEMIPADAGPNAARVIMGVYRELERERRRAAEVAAEQARLQGRLSAAQRRALSAKKGAGNALGRRYRPPRADFGSDADRFAYEKRRMDFLVYDVWVERVAPDERALKPLPAWRYDAGFFDALGQVDVVLAKVLRCMVDVLCDRLATRCAHMLRTGAGADNPARKTAAGDLVWRCYIEEGHPQAARLHFTRTAGRGVTFVSVRRHDDMRT